MSKSKKKKVTRKKRSRSVKSSSGFQSRHLLLAIGIIALVTFIAYMPALNADFADIDDRKLVLNRGAKFSKSPAKIFNWDLGSVHYKPVTYLTWMLEYKAVGESPFLYHFNNVLLHILNSILVFFLAFRLVPKFDKLREHAFLIALFSGLIFGVHPLHVESVAWIVERKDVLFTCFYLLGLLGYVRYLETNKILPLALSAAAYLLSIFSKSPGITMIAVLFLLDFVWKRPLSTRLITEKAGHLGVVALAFYAFGVFGKGQGEGKIGSLGEEQILARAENVKETHTLYGKALLGSMRAWLWYLHSLLPFRTSLGYPREAIISFFGSFIHVFPVLLAAAGGVLFWFRNRIRLMFFGHVFFFFALVPAITRLGLGIGIFMSDRYVYLSLFGLIFWLVAGFMSLNEKGALNQRVKIGVLAGITLLFAALSFQGAGVWKNVETLWTNVIEKYPSVPYAYINRAAYYRDLGEFQKALDDVNKGVTLDPNANALIQRGLVLRQSGHPEKAIEDYTRAIEKEPKNTQAYTNRGNAYLDLRQLQQAIADFDFVLARERNAKAAMNRGIAYAQLGQFNKAEESFALSQRTHSSSGDLYLNRAIMYFQWGRFQDAIADYERYLKYNPNDHQIWNDMGVVYQRLNRHDKALEMLNKAISIHPFRDYYIVRARSHEALGNVAAANADRAAARGQ